jgi:hypothetical protein
MTLTDRFTESYLELNETQAEQLSHSTADHVIEIKPPHPANNQIPAALNRFTANIREIQSKWFGLLNASPVTTFEIRRTHPDKITLQLAVPTKRLERKVRTQLTEEIPGIKFAQGVSGLPVTEEISIGGGLLTTGRRDHYPLRTDFDKPPINSITAALHRHAMQDTRFIIQILFQPAAGHPVKRWWWNRRAYKQLGYLRQEKHATVPWHNRPATPQEKKQADQIERKARKPRFHTAIRFLIIGAGEHTKSRTKELSGGYNTYENPVSNQYLDTVTIQTLLPHRIADFAEAVRQRRLNKWTLPFQTTTKELAALITLPNSRQENIQFAEP